jgi:hypothetical protein
MVTFLTRYTHNELDRKFKIKRSDEHITVISREEYEDYQEAYVCDTCGGTLEYNKTDDSLWCNTCVSYVQPKDAKKTVSFEIPQPQNSEDNTPLVSCPDNIDYGQMQIDNQPTPKGIFAELQRRGLRITNYQEYNP